MHVIIIFVLITGLIYDPTKNQKRLDSWLAKKKSTHQQSIKLRTKTNLIWFWQILSRYQRQDSRPTLATCRIVELWHVDSMMRYSVPCAVLYFCVFVVGTHSGQVSTGPLQTVLLDRVVSSQNHDSESELETVRCLCFHLFFSPTFFSPTNQTFVIVCNFCLKSTHNSTYMFFRVKMWMNLWFIIWTLDPLMCLQSLRPCRFHSGNPKETVVLRYLKFLWVIFFPNWPSCFSLLIYFMMLFLFSLSLSISIFVSLLLCPSSLWVCIYFTLVNTRSLCSLYVSQGEDGRVITQWVVTHSGYERGTHITVSPLSSHINVDNPHQSWAHLLPPVTPANGSVLDHFWPVRVVIFMSWCMFFSFYCFYYWKLYFRTLAWGSICLNFSHNFLHINTHLPLSHLMVCVYIDIPQGVCSTRGQ